VIAGLCDCKVKWTADGINNQCVLLFGADVVAAA